VASAWSVILIARHSVWVEKEDVGGGGEKLMRPCQYFLFSVALLVHRKELHRTDSVSWEERKQLAGQGWLKKQDFILSDEVFQFKEEIGIQEG